MEDKTTHFGYQTVDIDEKQKKVSDVFHSVAEKYDVMNDLMSFGIHRLWKKFAIELSGVRKGHHVLDLAGGTGDLAAKFAQKVGADSRVVLADINASMLEMGRNKLMDKGLAHRLDFAQVNAECLPFSDHSFDIVTIAFGLRNVTDKMKALSSIYRVLKPGGRLLILEFSKPVSPILTKLYDAYSFHLLPKMGKWIVDDEDSYRYLAESIRMHPPQETLKQMMLDTQYDHVDYHNMTGGIVALHRGFKY